MSASLHSIAFTALAIFPGFAFSADYGPAHHGGSDISLNNGDRIWGRHDGIRVFTVATSATVTVAPYDGSTTSGRGTLDVEASAVDVGGTITATGSGFTGGGGGAGGGASITSMRSSCNSPGGVPGVGDYGTSFTGGYVSGLNGSPGGAADGPFPGIPGGQLDGGYAAAAANGDSSADASLSMGSGGAGGSGTPGWAYLDTWDPLNPVANCFSGMGGGGGGRGGGIIRLKATDYFLLRSGARIQADGTYGSDLAATGQDGRNVSPPGSGSPGVPFPGGRGAGGGILVDLTAAPQAVFESGSTMSSLGGGANTGNGGTVKVFYNPAAWRQNYATVQSGRYFWTPAFTAVSPGWELYD